MHGNNIVRGCEGNRARLPYVSEARRRKVSISSGVKRGTKIIVGGEGKKDELGMNKQGNVAGSFDGVRESWGNNANDWRRRGEIL